MSDFSRFWHPRAVAVVGASANPAALGNHPVRFLQRHGYAGAIYPVNPRYQEVEGLPCYPRVQDCPGPVDLALVMLAADRVLGALEDCAEAGVPFVAVLSSGFAETGPAGAALQRQLVELAASRGMRILGPNCIGLISPPDRLVAGFSPVFGKSHFEPGSLGYVTQSGALGFGAASMMVEMGLRFSRVVNTGNEADLSTVEFVRELLLDDVTGAVLVYSEGSQQAMEWRELARISLGRGKPIVVLKAGRSEAGRRAAAAHSGAEAGDDQVWEAAFRQLGIIRVEDVEDLLDLAAAYNQPKRSAGRRIGVLTTSGGAGILAADALTAAGLEVPVLTGRTRQEVQAIIPPFGAAGNPVDVTAQVINNSELFRRALRTLLAEPTLDQLLICVCALQGEEVDRVVEDIGSVVAETDKPIFFSRTGAEELAPTATRRLNSIGVPVFRTPARAARAIAAMVGFAARHRQPPPPAARALPQGRAPAGWPAPGQGLSGADTRALLASVGLPVAGERREDGVQMVVRMGSTPLGPMMTVRLGGVLGQVLPEAAMRLAPIGPSEAEGMLRQLRGYPALQGAGGRPAADVGALADLLVRVSELAVGWPGQWELEMEPVVYSKGVQIAEARLWAR